MAGSLATSAVTRARYSMPSARLTRAVGPAELTEIDLIMAKRKKKIDGWGGARPGSGPKKPSEDKVQVTLFLRRDTVEALRAVAGSPYFGKLLQEHLDRHPITRLKPREPSRYITRKLGRPALSPEEREERRLAKMSKEERAFEKTLRKLTVADAKAKAANAKGAAPKAAKAKAKAKETAPA